MLEDAGIPRERILAVDREKVDDALDVTDLSESAVYEIEESEYVRKADVDDGDPVAIRTYRFFGSIDGLSLRFVRPVRIL